MPDENGDAAQKLIAAAKEEAEDARLAAKAAAASAEEAVEASAAATLSAGTAAASAAKQPQPLIVTAVLTLLCMVAAFYVGYQLLSTSSVSTVSESTRRLQISALVCFLGMAFACLGFGLFLIGATGAFKGNKRQGGDQRRDRRARSRGDGVRHDRYLSRAGRGEAERAAGGAGSPWGRHCARRRFRQHRETGERRIGIGQRAAARPGHRIRQRIA